MKYVIVTKVHSSVKFFMQFLIKSIIFFFRKNVYFYRIFLKGNRMITQIKKSFPQKL